jgi:hypothetical protein
MGVSVRVAGAVLLCVCVLMSRGAAAAPIIIEQTIADPLATTELTGSFTFDNDVALFQFTLDAGIYNFTAATTSYADGGFDPLLALYGADGQMVTYEGTPEQGTLFARNDNVSDIGEPIPDIIPDSLLLFQLSVAVQSQFTLALIQAGNDAFEDQIAFAWDDDAFQCATDFADPCTTGSFIDFYTGVARNNTFALDLVVTSVDTAPVPEPGTLSLLTVATAGFAWLRRLRVRRQHENKS